MTIYLATRTLTAINATLEADQGASYRQHLKVVLPHMADAYRGAEKNPYRSHMGASGIGKDCPRAIWYSFRWFTKPNFEGRILRLFNRGHLEEARFIALLLSIGVTIYQQDANGKQFRIADAGGHFGGSGDGIAMGIPDLPDANMPCLLEFKTHNNKSFTKLEKEGMRESKFEHFVQMQVYMEKMSLPIGLYGAVNKDNDALYLELVPKDTLTGPRFVARGIELVFYPKAPKRINESPGWFGCSFCDHKPVCHLRATPEVNCRTCHFAVPRQDGKWYCIEPMADAAYGNNPELSEEDQLRGCKNYTPISQ
ncbi:hypothetical protein UFOVP1254_74 [uncultured Caudovirales phage]|uniref:Exonuclease n=1 Tax=uncultured Caudovirales phage TaxID=2100421 RepID=A0A6J5RJU9_9CAUD|nr:hypothetical protein UFOVP1254_74 [uncultured Caudovirales phage]